MKIQEAFKKQDGEYLKLSPSWHVEDSEWKANQVLKIIKRNNITPKSIAEIGCGAGEILNQLYQKMDNKEIQFSGFEIAPDAFQLCISRRKERLNYYLCNLLTTEEYFDLLLVIDVFEHVEDYLEFIRCTATKATYKIYHIPLDISVFAILINNFKYIRTPGGHIHYFNKFTALETLKDCGLEIVDYFYTPGALDLNQKNLTLFTRLTNFLRFILYKISPDFTVNWLGGYSLMVLAK